MGKHMIHAEIITGLADWFDSLPLDEKLRDHDRILDLARAARKYRECPWCYEGYELVGDWHVEPVEGAGEARCLKEARRG